MHVIHIAPDFYPPSILADPCTPVWCVCIIAACIVIPPLYRLFIRIMG